MRFRINIAWMSALMLGFAGTAGAAPVFEGFRFLEGTAHLENGHGLICAEVVIRDPAGLKEFTVAVKHEDSTNSGDAFSPNIGPDVSLDVARKPGTTNTYLVAIPLNESAKAGTWKLAEIGSIDCNGVISILTDADLPTGAPPACVAVIRDDDSPPEIQAGFTHPDAFDVSFSEERGIFRVRVTDVGKGVREVKALITNEQSTLDFTLDRVSGDASDGTYEYDGNILGEGGRPGFWNLDFQATDNAGNTATMTITDAIDVTNTNTVVTAPPHLTDPDLFQFGEDMIDVNDPVQRGVPYSTRARAPDDGKMRRITVTVTNDAGDWLQDVNDLSFYGADSFGVNGFLIFPGDWAPEDVKVSVKVENWVGLQQSFGDFDGDSPPPPTSDFDLLVQNTNPVASAMAAFGAPLGQRTENDDYDRDGHANLKELGSKARPDIPAKFDSKSSNLPDIRLDGRSLTVTMTRDPDFIGFTGEDTPYQIVMGRSEDLTGPPRDWDTIPIEIANNIDPFEIVIVDDVIELSVVDILALGEQAQHLFLALSYVASD